MSTLDIMRKVRKTEEEAEAMRKGAAADAREMLKAAEGSAAQEERQASQDLRAKVAAYHRAEDQKVDSEVDALLVKERQKLALQRDSSAKRVPAAADLIYERILAHGNH